MNERHLQHSLFSGNGTLATFDEGDITYMMHIEGYFPVARPTTPFKPSSSAPSLNSSPKISKEDYGTSKNNTVLSTASSVQTLLSASKTSRGHLAASLTDSTFTPPMLTAVPVITPSLSASDPVFSQSLVANTGDVSSPTSARTVGDTCTLPPSMYNEHHAVKSSDSESIHLKNINEPWESSQVNLVPSKSPSVLSLDTNDMLKAEACDAVAKQTQPGLMSDHPARAVCGTDVPCHLEVESKKNDCGTIASQKAMLPENVVQASPGAFCNLDYLESLPDVVENLSKAQKQQTAEIEHQFQEVKEEKEKLQRAKEKLAEVKEVLCDCKRHICLAEEDGMKITQNCKVLLSEVEGAVLESLQNTKRIQEVQDNIENNTRRFEEYIAKMHRHKWQIKEVESKMVVHKQLMKQQQRVQKLQLQKTAMDDDAVGTSSSKSMVSKAQLQQEMTSMKDRKRHLLANIAMQKTLLANEEAKQASLIQETGVLHKRNRAQLTRLKRQLKEAQLRNKQWHDEACHLQVQIKHLKKLAEV